MRFFSSRLMLLLVFAGLVVALGGCEKALFTEKQSRTPYDRYASLRGRHTAMSQQNAYGGDTPALRERLKPLEAP
jgi:hypothetical protein